MSLAFKFRTFYSYQVSLLGVYPCMKNKDGRPLPAMTLACLCWDMAVVWYVKAWSPDGSVGESCGCLGGGTWGRSLSHWKHALKRGLGDPNCSVSLCFLAEDVTAHSNMGSCHCLLLPSSEAKQMGPTELGLQHPNCELNNTFHFISSLPQVFCCSNMKLTYIYKFLGSASQLKFLKTHYKLNTRAICLHPGAKTWLCLWAPRGPVF